MNKLVLKTGAEQLFREDAVKNGWASENDYIERWFLMVLCRRAEYEYEASGFDHEAIARIRITDIDGNAVYVDLRKYLDKLTD